MDTAETYGSLPARWAEYLRDRAVPPEIARERDYSHVRSGKPLDGNFAAAHGFPQKTAGMLVPLHGLIDPGGGQVQLRLADPIVRANGKTSKFLTPKGQPNVLITHPRTRHLLTKPEQAIVIAEGVTRVDALAAFDIPAVGLQGVNNWKGGRPSVPIPDWEQLGIKGNRFVLAVDGDLQTNRRVNTAVTKLKGWLTARGADAVSVLTLPPGEGLDDWIASNAFEDRDQLLKAMRKLSFTDPKPVPIAPPPGEDGTFTVDDAGPWACTPGADVRRLLEYSPSRMCVVRGQNGEDWSLLVAQQGGRWSSAQDSTAVGNLHIQSALDWQKRVTAAVMAGTLPPGHGQQCTKWAISSSRPAGVRDLLAMVGAMVQHLEELGKLPAALTYCSSTDLDSDRFYIGAPNGVVDLWTAKLLPESEARGKFITRSLPDDFDPAALHPYTEQLVSHLSGEDRNYLLHALGYALRGNPARRIYFLSGILNGAKSTLLSAVHAALGDTKNNGYGMRTDVETFLLTRFGAGPSAHHAGLIGIQDARVCVTEEPPEGRKFNGKLLSDISGGTPMSIRDAHEKAGPARPATGTIFIAINPGQEEGVDTTDTAFADRTRILPYPALPLPPEERDAERISDVRNKEVRQATAALMVRYAALAASRPADPPSVAEATAQHRQERIGAVGRYMERHVKVTGQRGDYMAVQVLMERLAAHCGEKDGQIEGQTRAELIKLLREVVQRLPRQTNKRNVGKIYRGVRLLDESDVDDAGGGDVANSGTEADGPAGGASSGADGVDEGPPLYNLIAQYRPTPGGLKEIGATLGIPLGLPDPRGDVRELAAAVKVQRAGIEDYEAKALALEGWDLKGDDVYASAVEVLKDFEAELAQLQNQLPLKPARLPGTPSIIGERH